MSSIFTISILQSALELGFIYSLVVLALFISFTILNIADLSTDGCFTLGCAVAATVTLSGHPAVGTVMRSRSGCAFRIYYSFFTDKDGCRIDPCRYYCQYRFIYDQHCRYGLFFQCKPVQMRYGLYGCA